MRNFSALVFVICVWTVSSQFAAQPEIKILGGLGQSTESYLESQGVSLQREGSLLYVRSQELSPALREAHHRLECEAAACRENLRRSTQVCSENGLPYRRVKADLDAQGRARGLIEEEADYRWVYDPADPRVVIHGRHRGYVPFPAVYPKRESKTLERVQREKDAVARALLQLEPELTLGTELSFEVKPGPTPEEKSCEDVSAKPGCEFRDSFRAKARQPFEAGLASAATALNWLHNSTEWNTERFHEKHSLHLLKGLNEESGDPSLVWRDLGDFRPELWDSMEKTINQRKLPVIVALHQDGRDQIWLLTRIEGKSGTFYDPVKDHIFEFSCDQLAKAQRHADGNFVFAPHHCLETGRGMFIPFLSPLEKKAGPQTRPSD